jgi:hypothetical protein
MDRSAALANQIFASGEPQALVCGSRNGSLFINAKVISQQDFAKEGLEQFLHGICLNAHKMLQACRTEPAKRRLVAIAVSTGLNTG